LDGERESDFRLPAMIITLDEERKKENAEFRKWVERKTGPYKWECFN